MHRREGPAVGSVRRWFLLGGLVTALFVAGGCAVAIPVTTNVINVAADPSTEEVTHSYEQMPETFSLSGDDLGVAVSAAEDGGTWSGETDFTVQRHLLHHQQEPFAEERWEEEGFYAEASCPDQGMADWPAGECVITYNVSLPGETPVMLDTTSGTQDVQGLTGDVALWSTGGQIGAYELTGTLEARTSGGSVRGEQLETTTTEVRSGAGSVHLDYSVPPEEVQVQTTGGQVTVTLPEGTAYRVEASSGTGTVQVDVEEADDAEHVIEVGSTGGDIRITHPE